MRFTDHDIAGIEIEKDTDGKEIKVNRNDPMMPIAWTKSYQLPGGQKGKAFTSTIGAATDLLTEGTRRLIVNSVFWCLNLNVPDKADVSLIGDYNPTPYSFKDDQYWIDKNLIISSLK
jgi:hypothetical protein